MTAAYISCTGKLQPNSGFTLIELLVVMAILSLLFLLVAPLSQQQLARSEAQAERLQLENTLLQATRIAYARADKLQLRFDGAQLELYSMNQSAPAIYQFQHMFFPPQRIDINEHGIPSSRKVVANIRQHQWEFEISPLGAAHSFRGGEHD